jgi:Tfp pilus assembly protein PilF
LIASFNSSAARRAALVLLCSVAAGCTTLSLEPPVPEPSEPPPGDAGAARTRSDPSGASQTLLEQSRAERDAGDYSQASALLERALRIDPNNPVLWVELGELHLTAGNDAQAAAMARKALTLASGERAVEAQAERLLRAATSR